MRAAVLPLLAVLSVVAGPVPAAEPPLRVVTLNLWHDQSDWPARRAVILSEMRSRRPDVICLQEVLQHATLRNQAEQMADSLGMRAHFVSVDGVEREKRYGNAILTAHPLLRLGGRNLEPMDDYRVAGHVRARIRGRDVDVYVTHLHHTNEGGAIRATQITDLLAFVDSTHGEGPMVLAGDFNAPADAPELASVRARFVDVFAATRARGDTAAVTTLNPAMGHARVRIDHVFVPAQGPGALRPRSAEVLFRQQVGGVWASDHFGVVADLDWGATRAAPAPGRGAR